MLKVKAFLFLVALRNLLLPSIGEKSQSGFYAAKKGYVIEKVGQCPDSVCESSGLELASEETYWTLGDGGCPAQLFEVDQKGEVKAAILISAQNKDWEDLAKDNKGSIYIGDFGNNNNKRKDLKIYRIDSSGKLLGTIEFQYPDQKEFPPGRSERNFDCESFFWFNDSLYLFSKNRGKNKVKMYSLPAKEGNYTAVISDRFHLNSMITAADISPDNKKVALLSYGKIYFFDVEERNGALYLNPDFSKRINKGQTEGLVFINNTDLLVSNEKGKLYWVRKKK